MAVATIGSNAYRTNAPRLAKRIGQDVSAPALRRRTLGQAKGTAFPLASIKTFQASVSGESRLAGRVASSYDSTYVKAAYAASGAVEAKGQAFVLGAIEPGSLSGELGAMVLVRGELKAEGSAQVGQILQVAAAGKASAEVGSAVHAKGKLRFGMDSLGLPSFEASGGAEALAGAKASSSAQGRLNILELVEFDVGGTAEAIAGAAAALFGGIGYRDGRVWINSRASVAAGAGVSGGADVGVGLGKIPQGVLMTTIKPVLAIPTLAVSTLYKGVASLFGADTGDVSDLTDLPKVAADAVVEGTKTIADGVCGIGKQIANVGSAIGQFFVDLF